MIGGTRARAFTLLEGVIAAGLLLVLIGVGFSFMLVQTNLAKQQSAEALGNVESQQAFDRVADAIRDTVVDDVNSDFCAAAVPTETMGVLVLYPIETAAPYANLKLQVTETQRAIIDVVDAAGNRLPKIYDAAANGTGRLRFGIDTSSPLDYVPDEQIRILSHDVSRFRVIDQGGQFVRIELTLRSRRQGANGEEFQESTTAGQVAVQHFDVKTME
ncbi:MAG: type II secretion system protein [Planctomycetota bacterium]|nr:MAG: type II secretion system protein [Planctomycetota bacterium]